MGSFKLSMDAIGEKVVHMAFFNTAIHESLDWANRTGNWSGIEGKELKWGYRGHLVGSLLDGHRLSMPEINGCPRQ